MLYRTLPFLVVAIATEVAPAAEVAPTACTSETKTPAGFKQLPTNTELGDNQEHPAGCKADYKGQGMLVCRKNGEDFVLEAKPDTHDTKSYMAGCNSICTSKTTPPVGFEHLPEGRKLGADQTHTAGCEAFYQGKGELVCTQNDKGKFELQPKPPQTTLLRILVDGAAETPAQEQESGCEVLPKEQIACMKYTQDEWKSRKNDWEETRCQENGRQSFCERRHDEAMCKARYGVDGEIVSDAVCKTHCALRCDKHSKMPIGFELDQDVKVYLQAEVEFECQDGYEFVKDDNSQDLKPKLQCGYNDNNRRMEWNLISGKCTKKLNTIEHTDMKNGKYTLLDTEDNNNGQLFITCNENFFMDEALRNKKLYLSFRETKKVQLKDNKANRRDYMELDDVCRIGCDMQEHMDCKPTTFQSLRGWIIDGNDDLMATTMTGRCFKNFDLGTLTDFGFAGSIKDTKYFHELLRENSWGLHTLKDESKLSVEIDHEGRTGSRYVWSKKAGDNHHYPELCVKQCEIDEIHVTRAGEPLKCQKDFELYKGDVKFVPEAGDDNTCNVDTFDPMEWSCKIDIPCVEGDKPKTDLECQDNKIKVYDLNTNALLLHNSKAMSEGFVCDPKDGKWKKHTECKAEKDLILHDDKNMDAYRQKLGLTNKSVNISDPNTLKCNDNYTGDAKRHVVEVDGNKHVYVYTGCKKKTCEVANSNEGTVDLGEKFSCKEGHKLSKKDHDLCHGDNNTSTCEAISCSGISIKGSIAYKQTLVCSDNYASNQSCVKGNEICTIKEKCVTDNAEKDVFQGDTIVCKENYKIEGNATCDPTAKEQTKCVIKETQEEVCYPDNSKEAVKKGETIVCKDNYKIEGEATCDPAAKEQTKCVNGAFAAVCTALLALLIM